MCFFQHYLTGCGLRAEGRTHPHLQMGTLRLRVVAFCGQVPPPAIKGMTSPQEAEPRSWVGLCQDSWVGTGLPPILWSGLGGSPPPLASWAVTDCHLPGRPGCPGGNDSPGETKGPAQATHPPRLKLCVPAQLASSAAWVRPALTCFPGRGCRGWAGLAWVSCQGRGGHGVRGGVLCPPRPSLAEKSFSSQLLSSNAHPSVTAPGSGIPQVAPVQPFCPAVLTASWVRPSHWPSWLHTASCPGRLSQLFLELVITLNRGQGGHGAKTQVRVGQREKGLQSCPLGRGGEGGPDDLIVPEGAQGSGKHTPGAGAGQTGIPVEGEVAGLGGQPKAEVALSRRWGVPEAGMSYLCLCVPAWRWNDKRQCPASKPWASSLVWDPPTWQLHTSSWAVSGSDAPAQTTS